MASEKQTKANQNNARKCTGPRNEPGKAASSRNALSHGLTAERLFLEGEDPALFEQLRLKVFADFRPVSGFEIYLAHRITSLLWRLQRVPAFEVAVFSALSEPRDITPAAASSGSAKVKQGQTAESPKQTFSPRLTIAQAIELAFAKNFFDKITRYEAGLTNQLRRAVSDLLEMISDREERQALVKLEAKAKPPSPPPEANASAAFDKFDLG